MEMGFDFKIITIVPLWVCEWVGLQPKQSGWAVAFRTSLQFSRILGWVLLK